MHMSRANHSPADRSAEACAECVKACACDACFEELVRRFQQPLLHFLVRRTGSRHDAEDLMQETFLLAHRKIGQYQSSWRFSTWLFTIATRLVATSKRGSRLAVGEIRSVEQIDAANPQAGAEMHEAQSKLWDTVQRILDSDAFAAVWLSYVESMSAEEIGKVLERSANAVRILLHRARTRLAESLDKPESAGARR
jgi:RNA polymerase sigma-70 factor (ECF subfamily)